MTGSTEQYCLRWNSHSSTMLVELDDLLQTGSFADMTLACEDGSIRCHKMVLAACSPFVRNLLLENDCNHPIVILQGIKFKEIKAILEYMYRGVVNVAGGDLAGVLKAAETLKVKGLVEDRDQLKRQPPVQLPFIPEFQMSSNPTFQLPVSYWPSYGVPVSTYVKNDVKMRKEPQKKKGTPVIRNGFKPIQPKPTEPAQMPLLKSLLSNPTLMNYDKPSERRHEDGWNLEVDAGLTSITKPILSTVIPKGDNLPNKYADKNGSILTNYIRIQKPEEKRYKQYTKEQLMSAIEAVRQGMTALQAARRFNLPSRTLYDNVKRRGIKIEKRSHLTAPYQYQAFNLMAEESDFPRNGSLIGNGSEINGVRMDSKPGPMEGNHEVTSSSLNVEDSNHVYAERQLLSKEFSADLLKEGKSEVVNSYSELSSSSVESR